MIRKRWFILSVLLGASGFAGCSSDDESRCIQGVAPAEVCVTGSKGNLKIEASGLEPGSEFVYGTELTGQSTVVVAENGIPDAGIGLLGDLDWQSVSVAGVSESGSAFEGDIPVAD